jgi:hypothetical protein
MIMHVLPFLYFSQPENSFTNHQRYSELSLSKQATLRRNHDMHNDVEPACWLENAGARIPTFSAQEVFWEGSPTMLFYLCSRSNTTFTVIVDCRIYIKRKCTAAFPDIQAILYIDGIHVAALVTDVRIRETLLEFEGVYDGDEAIRPFRFEKLIRHLNPCDRCLADTLSRDLENEGEWLYAQQRNPPWPWPH